MNEPWNAQHFHDRLRTDWKRIWLMIFVLQKKKKYVKTFVGVIWANRNHEEDYRSHVDLVTTCHMSPGSRVTCLSRDHTVTCACASLCPRDPHVTILSECVITWPRLVCACAGITWPLSKWPLAREFRKTFMPQMAFIITGLFQGVAMDSLKCRLGPAMLT